MLSVSDILITADFDRTFTACNGSIPQRNLDAIRDFTAAGGAFTINTGRSAVNFADYLDLPVNAPFLLCNGAAAYQNGQVSQCVEIPLDPWEMVDTLHGLFPELDLEIQGVDCHYLVEPTEKVLALYERVGWPWKVVQKGMDIGPFIKLVFYGQPHKPSISNFYEATPEEKARFDLAEETVLRLYGDHVTALRAAPRILNIHAKGVSKLAAARRLQQTLDKKLLIAVGDAQNDVAMLDGADYAFCPADGAVADRYPNVCVCDEGAIADVIYKEIPKLL